MAELDDALLALTSWLEREGIPYMVIGGFAVTIWGEPRFTRDLELTLSVEEAEVPQCVRRLTGSFEGRVRDPETFVAETSVLPIAVAGVPVDLIFARLLYEQQAIARARAVETGAGSVQVATPEDLILYNVVSPRPRDHDDVEGIFRHRHGELDYNYLDPRVRELSQALDDPEMLRRYTALRQRWNRG